MPLEREGVKFYSNPVADTNAGNIFGLDLDFGLNDAVQGYKGDKRLRLLKDGTDGTIGNIKDDSLSWRLQRDQFMQSFCLGYLLRDFFQLTKQLNFLLH